MLFKPAANITDNRKGATERDRLQTTALAEALNEPGHDITRIFKSALWSGHLYYH